MPKKIVVLKTMTFNINIMRSSKCRSMTKYLKIAVILSAILAPIYYLFFHCKPQDWLTALMTYYLAVMTAAVIWWQGRQLKMQLELQVLTELYKEWNSTEMKISRDKSFDDNSDLDTKEHILEFFERIASYYLRGVLSDKLIWDTIGWYVLRYYFYYHEANIIDKIRSKWGDDETLYWDLGELYNDIVKMDIHFRKIPMEQIEKKLLAEKKEFISSEKR